MITIRLGLRTDLGSPATAASWASIDAGRSIEIQTVLLGADSTGTSLTGPAAFNKCIAGNDADIYALLEPGVLAGPGWLERLLDGLHADPKNGLAGPSTNRSWNEQGAFAHAGGTAADIARTAAGAFRRFGAGTRTLEPLHSLADFCYVVRREVVEAIGSADEGYGAGPCWEMDYNIRAARAGWRGVWVGGAYVHRAPVTPLRAEADRRHFVASKQRYQDKFCGARLRGEKADYRAHCRGDACPNFAPAKLIRLVGPATSVRLNAPPSVETKVAANSPTAAPQARPPTPAPPAIPESHGPPQRITPSLPLVSCIMPTNDRLAFVPGAIACFLRQDYPNLELVVVDDGITPVGPLLPRDPRVRLIRQEVRKCIGAKRNLACAEARGEIIVHWDDDDWYPADRVSRQVQALRSTAVEICGTSTLYYHDAKLARSWRYLYGDRGRPWVAGNTLAYRKSWWAAHRFAEIQVGEDSHFVFAAPRSTVHDLATPDLCVARVHARNTSPKSISSSCWRPCPSAEPARLLGADWAAWSGASPTDPDAPLVSCIMPTGDRRALLQLALRAYERQDYPARELIVVDDGADPVGDVVGQIAGARYVRLTARATIGEKRNRACLEARGAIIAHWDDDDWYAPGRLRAQVAPLMAGTAELTGLENAFVLELPHGRFWGMRADLHRRMFVGDVHGGTLVFWKRLFTEGLRYPAVNLAEDAALIKAAQQRRHRLVRVANGGLYVYVRHGTNAWRFVPGHFIDSSGWSMIDPPGTFPLAELPAWQQAASSHGRAPVLPSLPCHHQ